MLQGILWNILACTDARNESHQTEQSNIEHDESSKTMNVSIDPYQDILRDKALHNQHAYERLIELCDDIGHRISGSPELDRAILWTQEKMKEDGLINVHTQDVLVNYWKRGEEKLILHSPTNVELPMLGLGMSIATPATGIRAEVVVVRSFDELENLDDVFVQDKIVLYNAPFTTYGETVQYRSKGASRAAQKGAVASLVRSVSPSSYQSPHTGALSYDEDYKIPAAAITLEDAERFQRWQDRGKRIDVELYMEAMTEKNVPSANVIGEIQGSQRPDEIVVIGGHLDSWDVGQGAQDDGAGVVIAMETARLIAELPTPPKRTLRVVLFTNEENGLAGAKGYADVYGESDNHYAAIEADIGAGNPLYFSFKTPLDRPDLEERAKKIVSDMTPLLQHLGLKDFEAGYAGADVNPIIEKGSVGFGLRMDTTGYWPIHHTQADTVDKVNPEHLQKNIAALSSLTWYLLNVP